MDIGAFIVLQNYHENASDHDVYQHDLKLGVMAESLGFDSIWCPEHHFDDYSMAPDNFQIMSYIAGQTKKIGLGIGAAILPWNDPLRVVEKAIVLDEMSGGRTLLSMGRGLAKMEYEAFGVPMEEARPRFNEGAEMVINALRTGVISSDGPSFPQKEIALRPAPNPDYPWDGRLFAAAMSPDTVPIIAAMDVQMTTFMQFPFEQHAEALNNWRQLYRDAHNGEEPGPPIIQDFAICHEDEEEARRLAYEHINRYFLSVIKHYDFAGKHWRETPGYETYQAGADMIREAGMEAAADAYVEANVYGTPEQIVEKYAYRHELIGDFLPCAAFSFGGLPFDEAEKSMKLFGEKVVPEVHKMKAKAAANA